MSATEVCVLNQFMSQAPINSEEADYLIVNKDEPYTKFSIYALGMTEVIEVLANLRREAAKIVKLPTLNSFPDEGIVFVKQLPTDFVQAVEAVQANEKIQEELTKPIMENFTNIEVGEGSYSHLVAERNLGSAVQWISTSCGPAHKPIINVQLRVNGCVVAFADASTKQLAKHKIGKGLYGGKGVILGPALGKVFCDQCQFEVNPLDHDLRCKPLNASVKKNFIETARLGDAYYKFLLTMLLQCLTKVKKLRLPEGVIVTELVTNSFMRKILGIISYDNPSSRVHSDHAMGTYFEAALMLHEELTTWLANFLAVYIVKVYEV